MPHEEQRRQYDVQIARLQVSLEHLTAKLEETTQERRDQHAAILERLDHKINGKLEDHASQLIKHALALANLFTELTHLKALAPPISIPQPQLGTKTTVETTDSENKPLTRRDLAVAIGAIVTAGTLIGLLFKYWPALQRAAETQ